MSAGSAGSGRGRLSVVLLWHMHQPEYRIDGEWQLPWTCLHALNGYADMAAHLEVGEGARAVVNFTPVLLEQLQDYAQHLRAAVERGMRIPDPLLDALRELPPPGPARAALLVLASRLDPGLIAQRHPYWRTEADRILSMAQPGLIGDAEARSFVVWTWLVWFGESLRQDPRVAALLARRDIGSPDDARAVLSLIAEVVVGLLPRYRRLADLGRIELSMTPGQHPILPLLIDLTCAHETAPAAALPTTAYPGGAARARWHIDEGVRIFESAFGCRPAGCWPAEAALSEDALALIADSGFRWTASSASVLKAAGRHHGVTQAHPYQAYRSSGRPTLCLFRDDGLSDRIGFDYQHWPAQDAVRDLLHQLEQIADGDADRRVVLIALDGENPWAWYPDNGIHFVRGLYRELAAHPRLRPELPGMMLDELERTAVTLPHLRAGSWVSGQLLTWIGNPGKNRAWELLIDAKRSYDERLSRDAASTRQLGVCEASDWFWWPGESHPASSAADFDALFRAQLRSLYRHLQLPPPDVLEHPFSRSGVRAAAAGGAMLPTEPPADATSR